MRTDCGLIVLTPHPGIEKLEQEPSRARYNTVAIVMSGPSFHAFVSDPSFHALEAATDWQGLGQGADDRVRICTGGRAERAPHSYRRHGLRPIERFRRPD